MPDAPARSYVMKPPFPLSSGLCYCIHEATDGYIGRIVGARDSWRWTTDLRGFRMAQHLNGTEKTLEAAGAAFKNAYEAWRSGVSDTAFTGLHRRAWGD